MSATKSLLLIIFLFSSITIGHPAANLALDQSIAHNDLKKVEQQIKDGADVNNQDERGFTPLHYAVCLAGIDIIEALLASGAQANVVSKEGVTPLKLAVRKNDPVLALKLLESLTYEDFAEHGLNAERWAMVHGHFEFAAIIRGYATKRQIEVEELAWQRHGQTLLPPELVAQISSFLKFRPYRLPHQKK